jgi:hypothetical protein
MIREVKADWLPRWGGRACFVANGPYPLGCDLPESSRVFFIVWSVSLYVNLTCGSPLVIS